MDKLKYKKGMKKLKEREELEVLLKTITRFNKYSFDNIFLIHNQKKGAEYLASKDIWEKIGRRVKEGSKGIRVMDINDKNETIKYLFELKDTTGSEISYKRVVGYSWEIKESNKIEITEEINKKQENSIKI